MLGLRSLSISASTILQLYINYPHWRLAVGLRLLAILFSLSTIVCNALILLWKPIPKNTPWWNFQSLNKGIPFLPCSFSIIWSVASIIKLFVTRKPFHPGADIGLDLFISLCIVAASILIVLGPNNQWRFSYGIGTAAGKLELVAIIGLTILLIVHFTFFVWGCRRLDVQRKLERRDSCDRCLTTKLREKMSSQGSSIEPMPSRQYGRYQQSNETQIKSPPPALISSSLATSPTAISPIAPLFSEDVPHPPMGAKLAKMDIEQGQKKWVNTRPRYYEIDDDDEDDIPPPTPPPKPRENRLRQVPYPSSIPDIIKLDREQSKTPPRSRTPFRKQEEYWRNQKALEEPRRYSISSYYYNMDEPF